MKAVPDAMCARVVWSVMECEMRWPGENMVFDINVCDAVGGLGERYDWDVSNRAATLRIGVDWYALHVYMHTTTEIK